MEAFFLLFFYLMDVLVEFFSSWLLQTSFEIVPFSLLFLKRILIDSSGGRCCQTPYDKVLFGASGHRI